VDWISSEPVDNYKGIILAFINEYGKNYREQYYNAGKDVFLWNDKGELTCIIYCQNDNRTINTHWTN